MGGGLTAVYTLFIGSIGRASFKLASQKLEGHGMPIVYIIHSLVCHLSDFFDLFTGDTVSVYLSPPSAYSSTLCT